MKNFLLRILALVGGVSLAIASGLLMFALYRAGFRAVSVFITVPSAMVLCLILSLVFPRRFELHGTFALVFLLSDEIDASGREGFMGCALIGLYILGWFGLFVSAVFLPPGILTGVVAVLSFAVLMIPTFRRLDQSAEGSQAE